MGRAEKPINPMAPPAVRRVAVGLRLLRHEAGLSYAQLAARVSLSVTTLAAAASGDVLPSRRATLAYVRGCGGDVHAWWRRWVAARAELAGLDKPPEPNDVTSTEDFAVRLRQLLQWHGMVNLADITRVTRLTRSTAHRALSGEALPTIATLKRLLTPCGLDASTYRSWVLARATLLGLPLGAAEEGAYEPIDDRASGPNPSGGGIAEPHLVPSPPRMAVQLIRELKLLRRGEGLDAAQPTIGPRLRQLCKVGSHDTLIDARRKVAWVLHRYITLLGQEEQVLVTVALNLPGTSAAGLSTLAAHRWYQTRVDKLARMFDRDQRTIRRRVDSVLIRLAECLTRDMSAERLDRDMRLGEPV
ncbi:helix-turn-helix domain-containing protein [Prauserella muralis]|uniref:helix-turn-helix domain-containing protein n=2 Tax=Prauserella muralis TaxID=588067 RepID=UPI0014740EB4